MKLKISDLQFARSFLLNEIDLNPQIVKEVLAKTLDISFAGEPNTVIPKGPEILYQQPTSITHFLFYTIYHALSEYVVSDVQRDKLSIGLLQMCSEYVHHDYDPAKFTGPPVLVSLDKVPVPAFIIHEIIEPLVGRINTVPILFSTCKFSDSARIIESDRDLCPNYKLGREISRHDYPFIFVNAEIYNDASKMSDILVKTLEASLGKTKTIGVLRNILLDPDSSLMGSMITVLKTLRGEPDFILDFLRYLESNIDLTDEESVQVTNIQYGFVQSDSYLNKNIKLSYANPSPQVFKQWAQWSMLVGLIEKQLAPMRGSMWPATENLKPFEDKKKRMILKKMEEKNKNQLNYEELLEVARDVYNHKAVEPGMLYEVMLKDNRVWKT